MADGRIIRFQELERFTGKKHDGDLPSSLDAWMSQAKALLPDVTFSLECATMVWANGFLGNGLGVSCLPDISGHIPVEEMWRRLDGSHVVIVHELAHLGACLPFFGPFRPRSLLIHIDGGASDSCASAWYFDGRDIRHLDHGWHADLKRASNNFNDSALSAGLLGLDLGRDHLAMPGKLMGFARYGTPRSEIYRRLETSDWLADGPVPADFTDQDRFDAAACIQLHFEETVIAYIRRFKEATGARWLYYSGGAALNIHANARIERELGFDGVFIPPCPSDCGLALGAAAIWEWRGGVRIQKASPFINDRNGGDKMPSGTPEILDFREDFERHNGRFRVTILKAPEQAAAAIADGKIIGVFCGKGEAGPRALGHSSLLCRPDSVAIRKRISQDMKQREWYRPVAPMVLEEDAPEIMEEFMTGSPLAKYMLGAWKVRAEWVEAFQGAVHADGSIRAQTIGRDDTELKHIRRLLEILHDRHRIRGVINTSFNQRGKPIVNSLKDAMDQAIGMGVDALWLPDIADGR